MSWRFVRGILWSIFDHHLGIQPKKSKDGMKAARILRWKPVLRLGRVHKIEGYGFGRTYCFVRDYVKPYHNEGGFIYQTTAEILEIANLIKNRVFLFTLLVFSHIPALDDTGDSTTNGYASGLTPPPFRR